MKNRKLVAMMLTMILSISSCFSVYGAEVYGAEASAAVSAQNEITIEKETEDAAEEETAGAAGEMAVDASGEGSEDAPGEEPEDAVDEESEEAAEEEPEVVNYETPADTADEGTEDSAFEDYEDAAEEELSFETSGDPADPVGEESVYAADEDMEEVVLLAEEADEQAYTPTDDKSSDELFAGYVDAEFGIADEEPAKPMLFQKRRTTAGSRLTGDTLAAYNYISAQLPLIASGEITSTHFTIPDEDVTFISQVAWTAEDLGVPSIEENGAISQKAKEAAAAKLKDEYFNLSILIDALLADHPYLLYWYDKTPKTTADGYKYRAKKNSKTGEWYLGYSGSLTLNLPVADEYAAGDYVVDASIGQTVQASVENALSVVSSHEDLPDYEKLDAYRQEICDLTSYNYGAIADDAPYGNPWQLIWVFDGDPATKVVCEGYSKAFKYLCDKSSFVDEIDCKIMTGEINGAGHMWNSVTMGDGWNYLVDVTNSDTGTVGSENKLFLVGGIGSPEEGYTVFISDKSSMRYTYDPDMLSLWSEEELVLSPYSYPPFIENARIEGIEDQEYTGEEITQELSVVYNERVLSEGSDYTVSYENNVGIGTAKVIIEGAGNYSGTVTQEFEITKATQPLSVSALKIANGRTETVMVTGAKGDVTCELSDKDPAQQEGSQQSVARITYDDGEGTLKIRGNGVGTAVLTVTAAESEYYKETVIEAEIRVVPGASTHVGLTNVASGIKVYWNEVEGAKYYKVYRGEKYLFTTSRPYATDKEVKSNNGTKYTYKVFASTTKDSEAGDSTVCRTGTGYRLVPVGITSLKNIAPGKVAVNYGKNAKSTGYVIRFGLKQDMSDAKVITVQGAGTLTRVLTGLKKGKIYYVQVRTYKLENGVRYYSGYCTTKSVKVTK